MADERTNDSFSGVQGKTMQRVTEVFAADVHLHADKDTRVQTSILFLAHEILT